MAHNISIVTDSFGNQIAEAMYANKPAWHGLGETFDVEGNQAPDSATAIRLAHLDWEVALEPMYLQGGHRVGYVDAVSADDSPDGKPKAAHYRYYASVRQDSREVLGVVGKRYRVCQNRDAFSFLDQLCMDGIMRYESAFAMGLGEKIALLARMPSVDHFGAEGDYGLRYVAFTTSHDGSGKILAFPTSTRIVCANTLAIAIGKDAGKGVAIRHTGDLAGKLEAARITLAQFDEQFTQHAEHCRQLAATSVSHQQAADFVAELFPEPNRKESKRTHNAWQRDIAAIRANVRDEKNRLPGMAGSWWQMVNAVTEHIDHGQNYRGDDRKRAEARFQATISGKQAEFKQRVLSLALSMAG